MIVINARTCDTVQEKIAGQDLAAEWSEHDSQPFVRCWVGRYKVLIDKAEFDAIARAFAAFTAPQREEKPMETVIQFATIEQLACALRKAEAAHAIHERAPGGKPGEDWAAWYANYLKGYTASAPAYPKTDNDEYPG
jgi:hypothetical protein